MHWVPSVGDVLVGGFATELPVFTVGRDVPGEIHVPGIHEHVGPAPRIIDVLDVVHVGAIGAAAVLGSKGEHLEVEVRGRAGDADVEQVTVESLVEPRGTGAGPAVLSSSRLCGGKRFQTGLGAREGYGEKCNIFPRLGKVPHMIIIIFCDVFYFHI